MTPSTCSGCGRSVILARVPWRASSLAALSMRFGELFHEAYVRDGVEPERAGRGPSFLGVIVGLTPEGRFVSCELVARAALCDAPKVMVRLPHDATCPAAAQRRDSPPGDRAECRGCGRTVYWIRTPSGKKAPLDPEPHTGVRLTKAEARNARGAKGHVIGLDRDGEQAAIREGEQLLLLGGAAAAEKVLVTVWVNHFATCPRRADFVRPR